MSGIYGLFNDINTSQELKLPHRLFGGLIFVGLIVKILSGLLNSQTNMKSAFGEATGTIWGYGIILFSLLGLVILKLDNNISPNKQFMNVPYSLYILAAIIIWIIIMNAINYKQINRKKVPPSFNVWSMWSTAFVSIITLIIMIQFYIDTIKVKGVYASIFTNNIKTLNVYVGFILFLTILITAIQWIIVQNFSVDG